MAEREEGEEDGSWEEELSVVYESEEDDDDGLAEVVGIDAESGAELVEAVSKVQVGLGSVEVVVAADCVVELVDGWNTATGSALTSPSNSPSSSAGPRSSPPSLLSLSSPTSLTRSIALSTASLTPPVLTNVGNGAAGLDCAEEVSEVVGVGRAAGSDSKLGSSEEGEAEMARVRMVQAKQYRHRTNIGVRMFGEVGRRTNREVGLERESEVLSWW